MSAVSPGARRSLLLAVFACLLLSALLLAGCGGGGDQEEAQSASVPSARAEASQDAAATQEDQGREEAAPEGDGEKAEPKAPAEPNPPIATKRTPGSKAVAPDVPVTEGGDNSIQAFGLEGEEGEAGQAAASLKAYLDARAEGNWQEACEAASAQMREELAAMVERARAKGEAEKPSGCAETLELFFGKAPASALGEAARIDRVLSFRVQEDGYAYLIYEAAGLVKFIAMASEGGAWKPNTPEPEAFQGPQGEDQ